MDAMGTSSESIENILPSSSNITQEELNIIDPSSIKKELDIDSVPEEFNIVSVFKEEIILPVCKETYVNIMCKEEMNIGLDCKEQVNVGLISNEELQGPSGFKEELTIVDSICKEFNMDSVCENNLHIENENICDNDINISEHVQNENISVNDGDIPERGSQQLKPSTNLMESLETTSDEIETKNTNRRPQRRAASACRRNLSNKAFESESEDDDKLPSDEEEDLDERLEGSDVDTSDSGSSLDSDENATDISQNSIFVAGASSTKLNSRIRDAKIKKRRQFTLEEKVKIIAAVDSNCNKGDVAKKYGLAHSTLSTILKAKKKIDEKIQESVLGPQRKRLRFGQFEDVDKAVFTWFKDICTKNIPISGLLLREKAKYFANRFGHETFQGSVGWLNRFRQRYSIPSKIICSEKNIVPLDAVTNLREGEFKTIIDKYNPSDNFNANETSLFFQLLPYRTFAAKGDRCSIKLNNKIKDAKTKKRRQFTLEEKVKIIAAVDSNRKKGDVAKEYGINPSTLTTILKVRKKIDEKIHEAALGPQRKRLRFGQFEDIDNAVLTWFKDIHAKNIPVSGQLGQLLCEKAKFFANRFGHETFQGSMGWLNRFRERYNIPSKIICREENDVSFDAVTNCREGEFKSIIAKCNPGDIFKSDDNGLVYRLLPYRTLAAKDDKCSIKINSIIKDVKTKKRQQFTLDEKVKIIAAVDGNRKKGDVAKEYGINPSTLTTILKARKKIDDKMHEAVLGPQRKRLRFGQFEDVDKAVFAWFKDIRAKNRRVSGPLLREKAKYFANDLGHETFQGSVGWLKRFRERYNISLK